MQTDLEQTIEIIRTLPPEDFEVDLKSDVFYYAVETSRLTRLHSIAEQRGVSPETLVNLWLQEKVNQEVGR